MLIVLYVSGHGFGHASRDVELVRVLRARRPDTRVIVRTSVPRWLFAPVADAAVDVQALETDTGVTQLDSLSLDEEDTAVRATRFHASFDRRAAIEAELVRGVGADLVVGDIPPLACAAAALAGVPSIALGNFTWDWIYSVPRVRSDRARRHPDDSPRVRHCHARPAAAAARRVRADGRRDARYPVHRQAIQPRSRRYATPAGNCRRSPGRSAVVRRLRCRPAARRAAAVGPLRHHRGRARASSRAALSGSGRCRRRGHQQTRVRHRVRVRRRMEPRCSTRPAAGSSNTICS